MIIVMKNKLKKISLFLFSMAVLASSAQQLPKKKETLDAMHLANHYFMNKWPDAGKTVTTNKERPSNLWTRAVYYEGLMSLYSVDKEKINYAYAVQWGEKHQWGLWGGTKVRNADNQCAGQT